MKKEDEHVGPIGRHGTVTHLRNSYYMELMKKKLNGIKPSDLGVQVVGAREWW